MTHSGRLRMAMATRSPWLDPEPVDQGAGQAGDRRKCSAKVIRSSS